ncbi:hypothetical protein [Parabacteroides sp. An277]|uniref:hypothetical protein n=1 Tax=Parabacteroides sp. An277 TaxID=1965619 RepID=UPI001121EA33|nr:hypothetical protein [Parabacteroides sp. An277]
MERIEECAVNLLAAYGSGDNETLLKQAKFLAYRISRNENQFCRLTHYYIVAKALDKLLDLDDQLNFSDALYGSIIKLIYYCLLRNYLEYSDLPHTDTKYADLVGGCELAFVIICENINFIMYNIIGGSLQSLPNKSEEIIRNQLLLFGGIVKNSIENHYQHFSEEQLSNRFKRDSAPLYPFLLTGDYLEVFKIGYKSTIHDICKKMEIHKLTKNDDDFFVPF